MTNQKLKVMSVKARDFLGIKEFAMEPGKITVLRGKNGVGKTAGLKILSSVFEGGSLAKLSRIDPDNPENPEIDPEIVVVLESEEGQRYIVQKNKKGVKVRAQVKDTQGFDDVPKPQRFLSGLVDEKLSNPIEFLNASAKDRILMLLGAMPLELDSDELWKKMDLNRSDFAAIPAGLHPLQELGYIKDAVFKKRTGVNRDAKAKAQTAEQTRRNLPAILPDDHEDEIKELEDAVSKSDREITRRVESAQYEYRSKCQEAKNAALTKSDSKMKEHEEWARAKREEIEALIAENLEETTKVIHEIKLDAEQEMDVLLVERDATLKNAETEKAENSERREKLATMREQAKSATKAKALNDQAEQFDEEANELQGMSERLTSALEVLDDTRAAMASDLPVEGVSVDEKQVYVNSIPYDQLNTAEKIKIAVKIACLRSTDMRLPIVYVDGAEALDRDNFKILTDCLATECGQSIIGIVDETELKTEVIK